MILLVCGGRDYGDYGAVDTALKRYINPFDPASIVIQGGAPGADALAKRWCAKNSIHCAQVDALWAQKGRSAGPRRNRAMLLLQPELVIAFPGHTGTENMIQQATDAGVTVLRYSPPTTGGE